MHVKMNLRKIRFTSVGMSALEENKFRAVTRDGFPLYPSWNELCKAVRTTRSARLKVDDLNKMLQAGTASYPGYFMMD
jgi:hypothetical protein